MRTMDAKHYLLHIGIDRAKVPSFSDYLLDEPEAALSPSRQLALLARLHQLVQAQSQFIIATHSPILMAYPNAAIYSLANDSVRKVAYTDTEHYAVTRQFLNNHMSILAELLKE